MAEERDERLYLADINDAIDRVLRYTAAGREAFFADPMAQDAVVRNIEIMGEATVARILILALVAAGIPVPLEASFGSRDPLLVTEGDLGNRISQTDANGHATWFEYDALGRQTARILPDGSREEMASRSSSATPSSTPRCATRASPSPTSRRSSNAATRASASGPGSAAKHARIKVSDRGEAMTTAVKAIYENGVFKPKEPVDLQEKTEVEVLIPTAAPVDDDDPTGWRAIDSLRGIIKDAPPDVAENHDFYLYGRPRR